MGRAGSCLDYASWPCCKRGADGDQRVPRTRRRGVLPASTPFGSGGFSATTPAFSCFHGVRTKGLADENDERATSHLETTLPREVTTNVPCTWDTTWRETQLKEACAGSDRVPRRTHITLRIRPDAKKRWRLSVSEARSRAVKARTAQAPPRGARATEKTVVPVWNHRKSLARPFVGSDPLGTRIEANLARPRICTSRRRRLPSRQTPRCSDTDGEIETKTSMADYLKIERMKVEQTMPLFLRNVLVLQSRRETVTVDRVSRRG